MLEQQSVFLSTSKATNPNEKDTAGRTRALSPVCLSPPNPFQAQTVNLSTTVIKTCVLGNTGNNYLWEQKGAFRYLLGAHPPTTHGCVPRELRLIP